MENEINYWGVPDSPIDWCEENYIISKYICEFYNTFSSFIITAFGVYGIFLMMSASSRDQALFQHVKIMKELKIRQKVLFSYLSLAIVGVGSAFYHATLLYKNQLFDEFPMMLTASMFVYCILTIDPVDEKNDSATYKLMRRFLPYILSLYVIVVAITITIIRDSPIILQSSFGLLIFSNVFLSYMYTSRCLKTPVIESNPKKFLYLCIASMGIAYISWLTERKLCNNGYVIPGVQLHAVWHALTGLAGFYYIQFFITSCLEKHGYKTKLNWNYGIASVRGFIKSY
ncbi:hypothetical protein ACTFIR_004647 [Dictyostelium discoideum]